MPRLLDNRLVGPEADVVNRVLYGATAGWALVVNDDGKSLILAEKAGPTGPTGPLGPTGSAGPQSMFAEAAKESYSNDSGTSIQQWLCTKWYDITPPGMFTVVADIAYGRGFFVAVGANGTNPVIAYASVQAGGTTWNKVLSGDIGFSPTTMVLGVSYSNGVFVACGSNGEIAYSTVGQVWNIVRSGVDSSYIYRVTYGYPHGWVAVGTAGSQLNSAGITLHSDDGLTWTSGTPALDDDVFTNVPIYSVWAVNGKFIAVGGQGSTNHIATSADGKIWTQQQTAQGDATHWRVTYGNGRFVVGTSNTSGFSLIGSNNGEYWYQSSASDSTSTGSVTLPTTGLAYGNGTFVAGSKTMYVSIDGVNYFNAYNTGWTGLCTNGAYGNGVFVMVSSDGKIIRSSMLNEYIGSTATPPPPSGNGNGGSEILSEGSNSGGGFGI